MCPTKERLFERTVQITIKSMKNAELFCKEELFEHLKGTVNDGLSQ